MFYAPALNLGSWRSMARTSFLGMPRAKLCFVWFWQKQLRVKYSPLSPHFYGYLTIMLSFPGSAFQTCLKKSFSFEADKVVAHVQLAKWHLMSLRNSELWKLHRPTAWSVDGKGGGAAIGCMGLQKKALSQEQEVIPCKGGIWISIRA